MRIVRYEQGKVPPLTAAQIAELHAMSVMPENTINFEEIPTTSEDVWKNASIGRFYKPTKTPTTLRVDTDVLAWLKAQVQSPINFERSWASSNSQPQMNPLPNGLTAVCFAAMDNSLHAPNGRCELTTAKHGG